MKFTKPSIKFPSTNNVLFIKILIGILVLGNLWFGISKILLKKNFNKEKQELIEAYEVKLTENIENQLKLVTTTFVWSIRSEMMRDNYDQIDLYLNQLVKEDDHITEVSAINKKGKVMVSTNKRYEEKSFEKAYKKALIQSNEITIINEDSQFKITAPIMAFNNRIGTLYMVYEPDEAMLKIVPPSQSQENDTLTTDTITTNDVIK